MWILPLIGYLGLLLGFAFLTLAIASGLYYLSELVEEQTVPAKKLLTRLIYGIIAFQALLTAIDGLPLWTSVLSIVSHVVYLQNLRFFPIVRLGDPVFLVSCLLVLLNHYLWFLHFSTPPRHSYTEQNRYASPPLLPSFTEIASFFFLQVWLVPFSLFVSLSASENVLPSMGSEYPASVSPHVTSGGGADGGGGGGLGAYLGRSASTSGDGRSGSQVRDGSLGLGGRGRKRAGAKGLVRVAVDGVREWVAGTGEAMGLWRGERTRKW